MISIAPGTLSAAALTVTHSPSTTAGQGFAKRWQIFAAFGAVYVIWGSTYLGIRFAIETLPPWGMAAARALGAGVILLMFSILKREPRLSRSMLKQASTTGCLLMPANAAVCYVERWLPSGIVAVLIGAMPIWIMVFETILFRRASPSRRTIAGACIGLSGVAVIAFARPGEAPVAGAPLATMVLLCSSWFWALGTIAQKRAGVSRSPLRFAAWQMVGGGVLVAAISIAFSEPWNFDLGAVSTKSVEAWIYLVLFGSVVAFSAYSWLASQVEPAVLSTYAFVNPVIAVGLGWLLAGERVTKMFVLATALVLVGLWLLLRGGRVTPSTQVAPLAPSAPSRNRES